MGRVRNELSPFCGRLLLGLGLGLGFGLGLGSGSGSEAELSPFCGS